MILSLLTINTITVSIREQARDEARRTRQVGIIAGGALLLTMAGRKRDCHACRNAVSFPALFELATVAADMAVHVETGLRLVQLEESQAEALRLTYIEAYAGALREAFDDITSALRNAAREKVEGQV